MNRTVLILLAALLIQCLITAQRYWPESSQQVISESDKLMNFDPLEVAELQLGDKYDNEAVLRRYGAHWLLPELENLPADPQKVTQLLDSLASSAQQWPVAHSAAARQRFEVAPYHYQRRLTFASEDELLGTIYLGTSPGFRKVHARNETGDEIYSIRLNTFDAPAIDSAWLDPRLLQIRSPMEITADGYSLRRVGAGWQSGTGLPPDERELAALLGVLRNLQVEGVAEEDMQRDLAAAEAGLVLRVQGLAGDTTLELYNIDEQHFIHSSEYNLFFTLSAYDHDRLVGIDAVMLEGQTGAAPVDEP